MPADGVKYYPWFGKWSGETFGPTGLGDSLYINLVAVRSDRRRRGIGKKLLGEALRQAERQGVDVTLLSHEEENVRPLAPAPVLVREVEV